MTAASVAVITRDQDVTADLVVAELAGRGVGVVRFDLADFPERVSQIAYLVGGRTRWTGVLRGRYRDLDLSAVRAVWYRKPSPFGVHPQMSGTEQRWATAEAREGFGGVLAALPARWVNDPVRATAADRKPTQMRVAAACGLTVPDTLVTNDPDAARDFCHAHRATGVVYKAMSGGPASEAGRFVTLWASTVTPEEISEGVRRTAHLFQTRVPAAYAVRVTVVGRRLFASRIDTPPETMVVDWRAGADRLTHIPVDVPDDVANGIGRLMDTFGLHYAAPDFLVTADGRWIFVGDLNPNGQWAWITPLRMPITHAIADLLGGIQ